MVVVSVCIILEIIDSTVHSSEHVQSVIDDDHTHAGASHQPEHEHDHLLTSVLLLYMSVIIFRMLRIVHVIHDLYAVAKKMHEEKWEDTLHQKEVEIAQLKAKLGMKPESSIEQAAAGGIGGRSANSLTESSKISVANS